MKKEERYLFPADYMADPSVHVFNGRLYIYPSHATVSPEFLKTTMATILT